MRSIGAEIRRQERASQRRHRELLQQQKAAAKADALALARQAVSLYENHLELISSVHKERPEVWNWRSIVKTPIPTPPTRATPLTNAARDALETYQPGFFARLFGRVEKQRAELEARLRDAQTTDEANHRVAHEEWQRNANELAVLKYVAGRILARDPRAYTEAVRELNPFADISSLGTSVSFSAHSAWLVEAEIDVLSDVVVPKQAVSLLKNGNASFKDLSSSRRNDIYQDFICGCALRVGRELFALLPVETCLVHACGEVLDTRTGHLERRPILSVAFVRETFERLNFDSLDCSDSMGLFVHAMKFKKSSGFEQVVPLNPASFAQRAAAQ
jgi:hypothetical protein